MYQGLTYELAQVMPEAVATGLFSSLFTAQQPSGVLDATGAPNGVWVPIAGLVNIACTAPPPSTARIQATEVRDLQEILSLQMKHVLLQGYYPSLMSASDKNWNALIDGIAYDIMGAESDSQKEMTRVEVRIAAI